MALSGTNWLLPVALTLRLVCGLSTADIARAFLSTEPTIAQRLVRAKRTLGEAQVPFELPRGDELSPRLSSVLEVVYLVFNEGYSASAGEDLLRPALIDEARRLGRLVAGLDKASSEAAQVWEDLAALNALGALPDGSIPLRKVLDTAAHLASPRREAVTFEKAIRSLAARSGASAPSPKRGNP